MKRRRLHRMLGALAFVLAFAAIVAPIAQAHPAFPAGIDVTPAGAPQAIVASTASSTSGGFDWTDAGVGAGVAVGLVLLLGVAVATAHSRRVRVSV